MARLNLNMYDIVTQDEPDISRINLTLTLDSPAISLFEFTNEDKPLLLDGDTPALEAVKLLSRLETKVHFVVNAQNRFQGIIELENLNAIEFIKRAAHGYSREELLVSDFMIPRRVLRAFDIEELKQAKIQDVVHSLNETGAQYCLAVDRIDHRIRGIISREDIEHRLQIKIGKAKPSITQMVSSLKT